MSQPDDIHGRPEGRRESILSHILPENLPLPPSYISAAPIAREILSRDIAECSSESGDDGTARDEEALLSDSDSTAKDPHPAIDAKLAFHPNGVAYGLGYSTVPIQGLDRPVPNPREVEESLRAEIELLRDNDLIPRKSSESRQRRESMVDQVYRSLFSTRTRDHVDQPYETTPLLDTHYGFGDGGEQGATPPPEVIHERFEEAVAAQSVKTTWQREARTLVKYAAPLIVTFLLHYSVTIASVLMVGRLGMVELAAVNCKSSFKSWPVSAPCQQIGSSGHYDSKYNLLRSRPRACDMP